MLDTAARKLLKNPLERIALTIDRSWITPDRLTIVGLGIGLAAAVCAARAMWWLTLALWLASRLADGLDGPLARRRSSSIGGSAAGGYLDISADFAVYGSFVIGVGIGLGQSLLPFLFVLLAYYVNGTAFLAFSSIAERTGRQIDDGRSLSFLGGVAEGTETILVHCLWCVLPGSAATIAWAWAAVVLLSAILRIVSGYRTLK